MGILEWIGFVFLAAFVVFFILFLRRFLGISNFKKYKDELRQLSDEELRERKRAMDILLTYRDDVYLLLAIQFSLVEKEIRRRRIGFHDNSPQETCS